MDRMGASDDFTQPDDLPEPEPAAAGVPPRSSIHPVTRTRPRLRVVFHIDAATEIKAKRVAMRAIARAGDPTSDPGPEGRTIDGRYWLVAYEVELPDDPFTALMRALTHVTAIAIGVQVTRPWHGDEEGWMVDGCASRPPEPGLMFLTFEATG